MAISPIMPSTSAFRLNSWSNSRADEGQSTASTSTAPSDSERVTNKLRKAVGVPPVPPVTVKLPEPESTRPSSRPTATASGEAGDAGMPTRPAANTYQRPNRASGAIPSDNVSRLRAFGNPPKPGPLTESKPRPPGAQDGIDKTSAFSEGRPSRSLPEDGPLSRMRPQAEPFDDPYETGPERYQPPKVDLTEKGLKPEELTKTRQLEAKEAEVDFKTSIKATVAGAHMRGGAEPVRETGPNGKDYVVKHEITLDVTEEATPEETAAKMDLIRQATDLMPAQTATEQIAATNALVLEARAKNEIERSAREEKREEKREYVSQPVERLTSPPAGQIVSTSLLKAQLTAANERPTIALSETEPSLYDIHAEPPFDPTIPLADTEPRQEREAAPSREDVLFDRVAGSRRRVEAQENTLLGQAERRDRAEVMFDERQVRRAEAHEVSKKEAEAKRLKQDERISSIEMSRLLGQVEERRGVVRQVMVDRLADRRLAKAQTDSRRQVAMKREAAGVENKRQIQAATIQTESPRRANATFERMRDFFSLQVQASAQFRAQTPEPSINELRSAEVRRENVVAQSVSASQRQTTYARDSRTTEAQFQGLQEESRLELVKLDDQRSTERSLNNRTRISRIYGDPVVSKQADSMMDARSGGVSSQS